MAHQRKRAALGVVTLAVLVMPLLARGQARGPAIVPRPECEPSIREGPGQPQTPASFPGKLVTPLLGQLPASYDWLYSLGEAIGSIFRFPDARWLGYRSAPQPFSYSFRGGADRLYAGARGIGGRDVADVPRLGTPGRECPGDPFWVGFPRPGNVEVPPPFQVVHDEWDCFCRYDEEIACPTGVPPPLGIPIYREGPNLHRIYGGIAPHIPCAQCFGTHNIRKHDYLVGTKKPPHRGYPKDYPTDPGYQECLRQSIESYAGTGAGGQPRGPHIYGL